MPYNDAKFQPNPYQYVHSGETYASITENGPMQIFSYLVILPRTEAGADQGFFNDSVTANHGI